MKKLILLFFITPLLSSTGSLPLSRSYRVGCSEEKVVSALAASPTRACTELTDACWRYVGRYVIAQGGAHRLLPVENKNRALLEKWELAVRMHDACAKDAEWVALSARYKPFFGMVAKHAAGKYRTDEWWTPVDSDRLIRRWFAAATTLGQVVPIPFAWTTEEQRVAPAVPVVIIKGMTLVVINELPRTYAMVPMESPYYAAALSLRSVEKRAAVTDCDLVLFEYVLYCIYKGHPGVLETELLPHVGIMLKWKQQEQLGDARVSFMRDQGPYSQTPPEGGRPETPDRGA